MHVAFFASFELQFVHILQKSGITAKLELDISLNHSCNTVDHCKIIRKVLHAVLIQFPEISHLLYIVFVKRLMNLPAWWSHDGTLGLMAKICLPSPSRATRYQCTISKKSETFGPEKLLFQRHFGGLHTPYLQTFLRFSSFSTYVHAELFVPAETTVMEFLSFTRRTKRFLKWRSQLLNAVAVFLPTRDLAMGRLERPRFFDNFNYYTQTTNNVPGCWNLPMTSRVTPTFPPEKSSLAYLRQFRPSAC